MSKAFVIDGFNHHVQNLIVNWSTLPKKSINQLATLSGIRPGTVYKLLSGEAKVSNLHPTKVLDILSVLHNHEDRSTLKAQYKDALTEIFKEEISPIIDEDRSSNKKFIDQFVESLQDSVALQIYSLSLRAEGVSQNEVKDEFGQYGIKILSTLAEQEILLNSKYQQYIPANKHMIRLEREHIQKLIPHLNELYKIQNAKQERNYISMRIDSINADALKELYDLHVEFESKKNEVLAKPQSKGEIPFYCFTELETLIPNLALPQTRNK